MRPRHFKTSKRASSLILALLIRPLAAYIGSGDEIKKYRGREKDMQPVFEGLKIKTSDPGRKLSKTSRWWRDIALVSFYRSFCIEFHARQNKYSKQRYYH